MRLNADDSTKIQVFGKCLFYAFDKKVLPEIAYDCLKALKTVDYALI